MGQVRTESNQNINWIWWSFNNANDMNDKSQSCQVQGKKTTNREDNKCKGLKVAIGKGDSRNRKIACVAEQG